MIAIEREAFDTLGFDLDAEIAAYGTAMAAHAMTVNQPAPSAHPFVEAAYRAGGYTVVDDPAEPEQPLLAVASLAARKRRQIHERAETERGVIAPHYPQHEIDTWDQQLREATAFIADAKAVVPLLSAMAAARGWSVSQLAARVMTKAAEFAVAGGQVLGTQQALEDSLDAIMASRAAETITEAQARTQIAAIDWPSPS